MRQLIQDSFAFYWDGFGLSGIGKWLVRLAGLAVASILLYLAAYGALWGINALDNLWLQNRLIKEKEAIAELETTKQQILTDIAVLDSQEQAKKLELEKLAQAFDLAKTELQKKTIATDKVLDKINEIENKDFSNTNLDSANSSRCRAFPDSAGCPR